MTALAGAGRELAITLPTSAVEIAKLQAKAEAERSAYDAIVVTDSDQYEFADALLTGVVRERDAAIAMRTSATGPMYAAIRVVEGWFRPYLAALEGPEKYLRGLMNGYNVEKERREREARELAAVAAETGDAQGMVDALTVATHVAAPTAARASVRMGWGVKAIDEELLPPEWWEPKYSALAALAKKHKGDSPPVIAGVTFERTAAVGARR